MYIYKKLNMVLHLFMLSKNFPLAQKKEGVLI